MCWSSCKSVVLDLCYKLLHCIYIMYFMLKFMLIRVRVYVNGLLQFLGAQIALGLGPG